MRHHTISLTSVVSAIGVLAMVQLTGACTVAVPAAPSAPSASASTGQVELTWVAPAPGASAVTGYTVVPWVNGAAMQPQKFASTRTTQIVTGLNVGVPYAFTVAASNAIGDGPASSSSAPLVLALPGEPASPRAWSGDTTAFLRWTAPTTGSTPITGYSITPIVDGLAQPARRTTASSAQTVKDLTNGTTVRFRIAAVSPVGTGPAVETSAVTIGADPLAASASWIDVVNYVRQGAGVSPLTANPIWAAGLQAHYSYLENTPDALRVGEFASAHTENPASPWYSEGGATAGASADLMLGAVGSARANVEGWLASPFHAIGILRPGLRSAAYAATSGAAGLDVIRGLDRSAPASKEPVLLPGPGTITTTRAYSGGERPSPLDSCPGFTNAGLPIVVLLPAPVPANTIASLRQPDGVDLTGADVCVISARTYVSHDTVYGPAGLSVLQDSNAVIIIPRAPLQSGRQTVTLTPAGSTPITWSFTVAS